MAAQEPNIYIFYDIKKDGVILGKYEIQHYINVGERYRLKTKIQDLACYNIYLRALDEFFYDIKKDGVILGKYEIQHYINVGERYKLKTKIQDLACYNIYLRALDECFDLDTATVFIRGSAKIISDGYMIIKFHRYISLYDVAKDFTSIFLANLDAIIEKMNNIISETDEFQLDSGNGVIYTIKFHIATTDKLWGVIEIKEPAI